MGKSRRNREHTPWSHPDGWKVQQSSCRTKATWKDEDQVRKIAERETKFQGQFVGFFRCELCNKFHLSSR